MSTGRRAYDILRGYVNGEWERIRGVEMTDAERELNDALENPVKSRRSVTPESELGSVDVFMTDAERARQILGVGANAEFVEIRQAFERITKRTDPANFPTDSQEAEQAEAIHRRVHRAYTILTEGMDSTEKRFRSLEID